MVAAVPFVEQVGQAEDRRDRGAIGRPERGASGLQDRPVDRLGLLELPLIFQDNPQAGGHDQRVGSIRADQATEAVEGLAILRLGLRELLLMRSRLAIRKTERIVVALSSPKRVRRSL